VSQIRLRRAEWADADLLFGWRNDPYLVSRSSSQRGVSREEHLAWFRRSLDGDERRIFIILKDGEPIGQIRFDRSGPGESVVSVYVLGLYGGKGYGVEAIRLGCEEAFGGWGIRAILACVRSDNPWAQSAFRKAGFLPASSAAGCPDAHLAFRLETVS
jgi:RimJ/RimL family protein N-acetyltransferase